MRWVVLTPTFAVGLGVVVAAAMAAPTRSVTFKSEPDRQPCATYDCRSGGGNGSPATRPGTRRLVVPTSKPSAAPARPTPSAGRDVLVRYQTMQQSRYGGGFIGEIILTGRSGRPPANWVLFFSYPASQQLRAVWDGGPPLPHWPHAATVTAEQYAQGGGEGWSGGRSVAIVFAVSGPAGAPATCTIDSQPCQITVARSGPAHPGWPGYGRSGGQNYGG